VPGERVLCLSVTTGAQQADIEWAEIAATAPQLAQTMRRYLRQAATFLGPASVDVADNSLRIFAKGLLANTTVVAVADVTRDAIEDFKVYLAARPGNRGGSLSENTQRQRLRTPAGVLRADHRMGLGRYPAAQPDPELGPA
jgi:hypothetical protein